MYYIISDNTEIQQSYNDNENDLLCVICLSQPTDYNKLIHLQDVNQYIINCVCNVQLHNNCLKTWVDKTFSCPICRKHITINHIIINQLKSYKNINLVVLYIKYSCFQILHIVKSIVILNIILYISDNILLLFENKLYS